VKLVLGLFAGMLAIGAVSFWFWRAAPPEVSCADRVVEVSASPDGRVVAAAYERRCLQSLTTHVSLRRAGAPAQSDVFVAAGSTPVRLSWRAEREMVIESPAARVLVAETSWRNVGVRVRLVR
jgi:hypothetical protein